MQYPKIIILFNGGSHGDFLKASCEQMLFGKVIKINSVGQALVTSKFKNDAMNMWREGKKTSFKKSNYDHIEVSHVWYSEFEPFPSKFYYINYSKKINSTLFDILIKKPFKNNITNAIKYYKNKMKFFPKNFNKHVTSKNFIQMLEIIQLKNLEKFKKVPNIQKIDITELYEYDSMIKLLKRMNCYNAKNEIMYQRYYYHWKERNSKFIEKIK